MNSIDIILEQFNLDPLNGLIDIDPYDYFSENRDDDISQMYLEASDNAKKGNIITKLINLLKKAWTFICKWISKIWNFLKNLFTKKKKTADQIVVEVIGDEGVNKAISNNKPESDKPTPIKIPSHPKSEVQLPDVNLIFKPFCMEINNKRQKVKLNYYILNDNMYTDKRQKPEPGGKQGNVVGQQGIMRNTTIRDWDIVIMMIKYPELLEQFTKCIDIMSENQIDANLLSNECNNFDKIYDSTFHNKLLKEFKQLEFTMDELMKFQISLNFINKKIENFDQPKIDAMVANDQSIVKLLNGLVAFVSRMQMGVNTVTSVITNSFIIDKRFYGSLTTTEQLSEFIKKCISNGIPSKYISYNSYLVSDPSIKGDGSNGDENNPIWGQSRVVFYPPNKNIVHKVALSQWGVRANNSEVLVSDKFRAAGNTSMLTMITGHTANKCVIDAEEADLKSIIDSDAAKKLVDDVKTFCDNNNIPLDITSDVNPDNGHNLGLKNNQPVIIDYGMTDRTSIGTNKS